MEKLRLLVEDLKRKWSNKHEFTTRKDLIMSALIRAYNLGKEPSVLEDHHFLKIVHDDEVDIKDYVDPPLAIVCWHKRYRLGTVNPKSSPEEWLEEWKYSHCPGVKPPNQEMVKVPLYLYDHSGLSISTERFQCPWDSGWVGYAVDQIRDDEGPEKARERLANLIKVYDQILRGNTWRYVLTKVTKDGEVEVVDSCGFFIGDTLAETGIMGYLGEKYGHLVEKAWENRYV